MMNRKTLLIAAALCLPVAPAQALTPQQEKMQACNTEAAAQRLQGANRKAFMKDCLSADKPAAAGGTALTPQQQKMKSCNASAGAQGLKGPARKAFLSECLAAPSTKPSETPAPATQPAPVASAPAVPAPAPTPQTAPPSPAR
jgi:hypothetical protein